MTKALDLANGDLYLGLFVGTTDTTLNGVVTIEDGGNDLNIASHDGVNGLKLEGDLVTSTATELNLLDGVTSTTAELNILDGVTSTAAELNIMDGVTVGATDINGFAPKASPTFTGTVAGVTKTHVGLNNVDNTSDATKQTATLTAATKSDVGLSNVDNDSTVTIRSGTTASDVGLGNVTNESKVTMLSSPSLTGASIFTGGVVEKVGTASNSGTTVTVDVATGNFFQVDLASNSGNITTFNINNINATSNQLSSFILKVENSASNRNFTWSSLTNIDWAGGAGPDITAGDGKIDILSFTTYNNGTTWYGAIVGQDFN